MVWLEPTTCRVRLIADAVEVVPPRRVPRSLMTYPLATARVVAAPVTGPAPVPISAGLMGAEGADGGSPHPAIRVARARRAALQWRRSAGNGWTEARPRLTGRVGDEGCTAASLSGRDGWEPTFVRMIAGGRQADFKWASG